MRWSPHFRGAGDHRDRSGFRGDTATNVTKPATLETGAEIKGAPVHQPRRQDQDRHPHRRVSGALQGLIACRASAEAEGHRRVSGARAAGATLVRTSVLPEAKPWRKAEFSSALQMKSKGSRAKCALRGAHPHRRVPGALQGVSARTPWNRRTANRADEKQLCRRRKMFLRSGKQCAVAEGVRRDS